MRSNFEYRSDGARARWARAAERVGHVLRPARDRRIAINLALQGGGAHGAFTWGVLNRLLEHDGVEIKAVSGASAGAVNAVALAAGLAEGGREGAREKLDEVWRAVVDAAPFGGVSDRSPGFVAWDLMTRVFSPSQMNPFELNPLRRILLEKIDFRRVRREAPVELYLAATDVATGEARIFQRHEISPKAVLASACLPHLMAPVRIAGRFYWDGGFSANPPLWPLVEDAACDETLVVLVDPRTAATVPATAPEIGERLSWLAFGQPLTRELAAIERARTMAGDAGLGGGRARRRLLRHQLSFLEPGEATEGLGRATRLVPQHHVLQRLKAAGRACAETWLAERLAAERQ
jgi:NTE family protein